MHCILCGGATSDSLGYIRLPVFVNNCKVRIKGNINLAFKLKINSMLSVSRED